MSRLTRLSIRSILLLITFVVALPAAGVIIYAGVQLRNDQLRDAYAETAQLAERIVNEQQNLVAGAEQLMTALSQLSEVKQHDAPKVVPILQKLRQLNPMYSNIFIADRDGVVWATAVPVKPPFVIADRRYFQNALSSGRLSSGEYVVSRATTRPAFNVAAPLKDENGRIIGVISVGFVIDRYRDLLNQMRMANGSNFLMIDHRGMVLARGVNPEPYVGKPYPAEEFRKMKAGPDWGTSIRQGLTGDQRITSYRKLRLPGEATPYLYVTTGIPMEVINGTAGRKLTANMLILSSFLVLACAIATLVGKHSIEDRVKMLEDASRRLATGDLGVRVAELVEGGELGDLGRSFDLMAQELGKRAAEQQQMEAILRLSEERTRQAISASNLGVFDHDHRSDTVYWSPRLREINGWNADQAMGVADFINILHPDDRDAIAASVARAHDPAGDGIWDVEHRIIRGDGAVRWLTAQARTFFEGDGTIRRPVRTVGTVRDVTEQKEIQEEQRKLAYLVEMSRDFIGIASLQGRVEYLNPAAARLVGLEGADLAAFRIPDFFPKECRGVTDQLMDGLAAQGYWHGEAVFEHFVTHEPIAVEITAFTIYNEDGSPLAYANVTRDVRERKAAEAEKTLLTEQLIQAQKMESIGRLAGGVAHDFNNLLTPILGYAEFVKKDLAGQEAPLARIENVLKAANKARELVQQLLSFSRKQVLEMKTIDLGQVVGSFQGILRHTIRESIALRFHLSEEPGAIRGDKNQIEQVIMNLAINAQDAIDEHGAITIETAAVFLDEEYALQHQEVRPGRYLMLAVTDDGCGMDQATRQRIFEPFFTTKGIGKGTGLGLATVYGIVRQHGGHIWVYSEVGKGTTFKCYFPLVDEPLASEAAAEQEQVTLDGRRRSILVVEDNEMVRTLVEEMLKQQGFEVLAAESPKVALGLCGGRLLDLLITDVVMPGMTGPELYSRLERSYPDLKVLYMSGYTSNVMVHQGILDEGIHYIQKPFSTAEFARKVERALGG
ncbi:PAS domain S-box protein [Geomesophilobacter sediminis]|uniref:histidine kinase n=1 Tax=Geomesophilobacter sediminis TaxID=2798584 RepID=A0A8J7J2Z7_9BACT|nr:PAS domain S-box protein [Geomesophilobacter sediminis]MBJ6725158.1 PAS domain S-box protein [Geomesophilobacter sediminis]